MEIKTSETKIIRRSMVCMNPCNPKRHAEGRIEEQRRNIGRVGFLGGIVWNETTGNLVDGHRRLRAMDRIKAYDGTPDTDYDVKVEKVNMDEKTEKEQMTFMSVANTQPDLDLISRYASDIDLANVGLSDSEIRQMQSYLDESTMDMEDLFDTDWNPHSGKNRSDMVADGHPENPSEREIGLYPVPPAQSQAPLAPSTTLDEEYEQRKNELLDGKRRNRENAERRAGELNAYITLSFSSYESYLEFCRLAGANPEDKFVKGEPVLTIMEKSIKNL